MPKRCCCINCTIVDDEFESCAQGSGSGSVTGEWIEVTGDWECDDRGSGSGSGADGYLRTCDNNALAYLDHPHPDGFFANVIEATFHASQTDSTIRVYAGYDPDTGNHAYAEITLATDPTNNSCCGRVKLFQNGEWLGGQTMLVPNVCRGEQHTVRVCYLCTTCGEDAGSGSGSGSGPADVCYLGVWFNDILMGFTHEDGVTCVGTYVAVGTQDLNGGCVDFTRIHYQRHRISSSQNATCPNCFPTGLGCGFVRDPFNRYLLSSPTPFVMVPDADGTNSGAQWTNSGSEAAYQQVDDAPADDADYIWNADDSDSSIFIRLAQGDIEFLATIDSAVLDIAIDNAGFLLERCDLYCQLFATDETTALTDEVLVADESTSSPTTFLSFALSVQNNDATLWNGARLRLRWDYTTVPILGLLESGEVRVTAARIVGDGYVTDDPGCAWAEQTGSGQAVQDGIGNLSLADAILLFQSPVPRYEALPHDDEVFGVKLILDNVRVDAAATLAVILNWVDEDNYFYARITAAETNTHGAADNIGTIRLFEVINGTHTPVTEEQHIGGIEADVPFQVEYCVETTKPDPHVTCTVTTDTGSYHLRTTSAATTLEGTFAGLASGDPAVLQSASGSGGSGSGTVTMLVDEFRLDFITDSACPPCPDVCALHRGHDRHVDGPGSNDNVPDARIDAGLLTGAIDRPRDSDWESIPVDVWEADNLIWDGVSTTTAGAVLLSNVRQSHNIIGQQVDVIVTFHQHSQVAEVFIDYLDDENHHKIVLTNGADDSSQGTMEVYEVLFGFSTKLGDTVNIGVPNNGLMSMPVRLCLDNHFFRVQSSAFANVVERASPAFGLRAGFATGAGGSGSGSGGSGGLIAFTGFNFDQCPNCAPTCVSCEDPRPNIARVAVTFFGIINSPFAYWPHRRYSTPGTYNTVTTTVPLQATPSGCALYNRTYVLDIAYDLSGDQPCWWAGEFGLLDTVTVPREGFEPHENFDTYNWYGCFRHRDQWNPPDGNASPFNCNTGLTLPEPLVRFGNQTVRIEVRLRDTALVAAIHWPHSCVDGASSSANANPPPFGSTCFPATGFDDIVSRGSMWWISYHENYDPNTNTWSDPDTGAPIAGPVPWDCDNITNRLLDIAQQSSDTNAGFGLYSTLLSTAGGAPVVGQMDAPQVGDPIEDLQIQIAREWSCLNLDPWTTSGAYVTFLQ